MADRTRRFRYPFRALFSIAAIGLLLVACGGNDAANGNGNGNGNDDAGSEPVHEAQAIFNEVGCAECHGDQGQGVEGQGSSLQGTRMIYNAFETRVRNGRGQQMPPYSEDEISDEEIAILHEWLRTQ